MANERIILDLFDHVTEPLNTRSSADSPLVERGGQATSVRDMSDIKERMAPMLTGIGILPRGRVFSVFRKEQADEAVLVIKLLMGITDVRELQLALSFLRDFINEDMFVYTTSVLVSWRQDMRGVQLPPIEEVLPSKFITSDIISRARTLVRRSTDTEDLIIIDPDFTGNDLDVEHRLSYWREDIGLNAHHWHWHVVYPNFWIPEMGGMRDRKGELFYYMHEQMIARYDAERLSNNMARVKSLHNWLEPIPEGYSPHLENDISGLVYSSRPANMVLQDLPSMPLFRLRIFYDRIIESIHRGQIVLPSGVRIPFDDETGIDVLGAIVEASALSPNPRYYGDFHDMGHNAISSISDPDGRFKEEVGVMADPATAMRDPIFYRWHKFVDQICQELKDRLAPYTTEQLTWPGFQVVSIDVQGKFSQQPNYLQTFWEMSDITLQHGVNFTRPQPIMVRVRHIQHEVFTYTIKVSNTSGSLQTGTVRIFMVPQFNEIQQMFPLNEQRLLFMELDKFETPLKPGENKIIRLSSDSNVTIASRRSFGELIQEVQTGGDMTEQSFCSCGLPDHLLIPRGKLEGMPFQLFVMITNAEEDRVNGSSGKKCQDAASYCGVLNEKYPDRRPMGFPFDRPSNPLVSNINTFLTPNMAVNDITIRFRDMVVGPKDGLPN